MDFSFSDEQELLEETAHKVTTELFGDKSARAFLDGDRRAAERGWATLAELGWLGLLVPSHLGGSGAGLVEACIVAESLACSLAPVPYVGTAVASVAVLRHLGGPVAEALQEEIAGGRPLGLALDRDLHWPPKGEAAVAWQSWPGGSTLLATPGGVQVLDGAVPTSGADPLHPLSRLPTAEPAVPLDGLRRTLAYMRVGAAAALLGSLRGAAELAFAYVQERRQYGQTIGTFQAVQHLCADVMVDLDSCRSTLYGAAWTAENASEDAAERSSIVAKAWCGDAAIRSVETAVQLLGGIGVTWESTAHLYLRQARTYAGVLGDRRQLHHELGRRLVHTEEHSHGSS